MTTPASITYSSMADLEEYNVGRNQDFGFGDGGDMAVMVTTTVRLSDLIPVMFALRQSTLDDIRRAFEMAGSPDEVCLVIGRAT